MADISVQFHALPEEVLPEVARFVGQSGAHLASLKIHPFEAALLTTTSFDEVVSDPAVLRVALTTDPPRLDVKGLGDFAERNEGALIWEIGRRTAGGLAESWLAARAKDGRGLAPWQPLVKALRAITKAGATAIDPKTGARARLRNHRHTQGARALDAAGVPILPAAGSARLTFAETT